MSLPQFEGASVALKVLRDNVINLPTPDYCPDCQGSGRVYLYSNGFFIGELECSCGAVSIDELDGFDEFYYGEAV